MRAIWRRLRPDEEAAAEAWALAETDRLVERSSNSGGTSAEDYGRRLLKDGLKKGWL